MNAVDTAYKLGSLAAVDDFTAWLQNDDGNPTAYPKRRGSILKTAQGNPMQPNPSTMPNPAQPLPTSGLGGAVGKPAPGMGGGAPITPPPGGGGNGGGRAVTASVHRIKTAIMGRAQIDAINKEAPGAIPTNPPKPPPPPPPPPKTKTSADRAVEQVMRKLGKSMSRRPLSRDGTKYEALKKKLRKQKSKKD